MDTEDNARFVLACKHSLGMTRRGWAIRMESQLLNEGRSGNQNLYLTLFVVNWVGTPERMEKLMSDAKRFGYVPVPEDRVTYRNDTPHTIFRLARAAE